MLEDHQPVLVAVLAAAAVPVVVLAVAAGLVTILAAAALAVETAVGDLMMELSAVKEGRAAVPVLVVPDVIDASLCGRLTAYWENNEKANDRVMAGAANTAQIEDWLIRGSSSEPGQPTTAGTAR